MIIMVSETTPRNGDEEPQSTMPDEPDDMFSWLEDAEETGMCEATDGCIVEIDGVCPHGKPSWAIVMGLV